MEKFIELVSEIIIIDLSNVDLTIVYSIVLSLLVVISIIIIYHFFKWLIFDFMR